MYKIQRARERERVIMMGKEKVLQCWSKYTHELPYDKGEKPMMHKKIHNFINLNQRLS